MVLFAAVRNCPTYMPPLLHGLIFCWMNNVPQSGFFVHQNVQHSVRQYHYEGDKSVLFS